VIPRPAQIQGEFGEVIEPVDFVFLIAYHVKGLKATHQGNTFYAIRMGTRYSGCGSQSSLEETLNTRTR
jgi:hypothetical protein